MSSNRIHVKGYGRHEEAPAGESLKPGHLLRKVSGGSVYKHNVVGGLAELNVAIEDYMQGKTQDDAYAASDVVLYTQPCSHDTVKLRLAAGAAAVTKEDKLISAGDGTVRKLTEGEGDLKYNSTADSAAVTNTVTETAFDKSYTFAANTLKAGDRIVIEGSVRATATNSTDTLTVKVKIGSTVLASSGAVDVANNDICKFRVELTVLSVGASGAFTAAGFIGLGAAGTVTMKALYVDSTTIDTTATQLVSVTAQWSVANAGNSCVIEMLSVTQQGTQGEYKVLGLADESVDNSAGLTEAFINVRIL